MRGRSENSAEHIRSTTHSARKAFGIGRGDGGYFGERPLAEGMLCRWRIIHRKRLLSWPNSMRTSQTLILGRPRKIGAMIPNRIYFFHLTELE